MGAAATVICCGSPLLLSSGALAAAVGAASRVWALAATGVVIALGALVHVKRRGTPVCATAAHGRESDLSTVRAQVARVDESESAI